MKDLRHVHALVVDAQQHLAQMLQEQQQDTGIVTIYTFLYVQQDSPHYQHIEARSIKEAFAFFGNYLLVMKLSVSHICYGTYLEMEAEQLRVDQYWQAKKEQE